MNYGRKYNNLASHTLILCVIGVLISSTACVQDKNSLFGVDASGGGTKKDPSATGGSFLGCISGSALDTSRIRVEYEFPSGAERVTLFRDGALIASFDPAAGTIFTDVGLNEGQTYRYSCEATFSGKVRKGSRIVEVATQAATAPIFDGIISATALTSRSVRVRWNPASSSGVGVATYKIYANPGSAVDWNTSPLATVQIGAFETVISNLGDELPYAFGVRACSSAGICDSNTALRALTLSDGGAPQTTGISAATIVNGQVVLTVPWSASNGAVKKRKIYYSTVSAAAIDYTTPLQTVVVSDITNPTTSLTVTGLPAINENTTYYFVVRDEDPSVQTEGNSNFVAVNTGDLTAPLFSGLTALNFGTPSDTVLDAGWTAIASQPGDSNGASHYLIYYTSSQHPAVPADPCVSGSLKEQVAATAYTSGQAVTYSITGLQPRTSYKFCVKARDLAGNISNTTISFAKITKDLTPPVFDGAQTVAYTPTPSPAISITWNPSTSSDALEYKVQVWKNTANPAPNDITLLTRTHSTNPLGFSLLKSDYSFNDGDTVYVLVNACDDASPTYGNQNCTSLVLAKSAYVPDSTQPPNFLGITNSLSYPFEAQVTVNWYAPTDWSDYKGFMIYTVNADNSLTFRKNCACSAMNCPELITSCTITSGLDPYRTYAFHVRAYDAAGNETTYLNPAFNRTSGRTSDTTAPSFASNLGLSFVTGANPGANMSWSAATDNQYNLEPGAQISYLIYRKQGSSFVDPANPASGGTLISTQTTPLSYFDAAANLIQGQTYYYELCARDASGNTTCDGSNIKNVTVPDTTPPQIGSLAFTYTTPYQVWNLSWAIWDAVTAKANLQVTIRRIEETSNSVFPTGIENIYLQGLGWEALNGEVGFANADKYINYRITVRDEAGNEAFGQISVRSDKFTAITITSPTDLSTVKALAQQYVGTCEPNATITVTPSGGETVISKACDGSGNLSVVVHFLPGVAPHTVQISADDGHGNTASVSNTVSNTFACPTNYVGVPKNFDITGSADICLAKYEMKATVGGTLVNGGNGNIVYNVAYTAESRYDGTPWVKLSMSEMIGACSALGVGYRMMNNADWQTVARNVEDIASNWSGGTVGSGGMYHGHTDYSAGTYSSGCLTTGPMTLAADADDNNGYVGTGNNAAQPYYATNPWNGSVYVSGKDQKRTLILSNGSVIWDLAGNGAEGVNTWLTGASQSPSLTPPLACPDGDGGWTYCNPFEFTDATYFPSIPSDANRRLLAPKGNYSSANGVGQYTYWSDGYLSRGGSFQEPNGSGVFGATSAWLGGANNYRCNHQAFRCVYIPQ